MKIISKENEDAHYAEVLKGGLIGGTIGLALGLGGVVFAHKRYPAFKNITLPFRSFLVSSAGTFGAIVTGERYGLVWQKAQDPMNAYQNQSQHALEEARKAATQKDRLMQWGRENRYTIVFTSWVASMGLATAMVSRHKYWTASQKIVQARMYAQGLTLAVLIATAIFETADAKSGKGRWETVLVVDPNDPEHKHMIEKRVEKEDYQGQNLWKDMVEAEEKRLAEQKKSREAILQQAESGDKKQVSASS